MSSLDIERSLMILQPENGILSYTGRGFREGDNDAATKGVNRRTVMSGRERISDKDIAEWIKEVEDDTSPKEVASNPSRKNRRPIGMTKATIDLATRRLTARVLYRPPTNVSPRMRARRHPFVDCLSCVGGLLILARGLWLLGSRLLALIRRLCGLLRVELLFHHFISAMRFANQPSRAGSFSSLGRFAI